MNINEFLKGDNKGLNGIEGTFMVAISEKETYLDIVRSLSDFDGFDKSLLKVKTIQISQKQEFFHMDISDLMIDNALHVEYDGVDITGLIISDNSLDLWGHFNRMRITERNFLLFAEQEYIKSVERGIEKLNGKDIVEDGVLSEEFLKSKVLSFINACVYKNSDNITAMVELFHDD